MIDRRILGGVAVALLASGCFGTGGSDGCGNNGILGNSTFRYSCRSDADAFCDGSAAVQISTYSPLPTAVARGGWFGLDVVSPQATVSPVSSRTVKSESGRWFRTTRAGSFGFLAEDGTELLDAVRLVSVEPTGLRVDRIAAGLFPEQVSVGSQVRIRAVPRGTVFGVEQDLAAALPVDFTTDDPQVEPTYDAYGVAVVTPRRAGKLIVRASFEGRLQAETTLNVDSSSWGGYDAGGPPPLPADAGAGADADTSTDGGGQ